MTGETWEAFTTRLIGVGVNAAQGALRIAVILAIAYFAVKLLRAGLNRLEAFLIGAAVRGGDAGVAIGKRIKTLSSVLWTLSAGLLWFLVALVILSQIGVNIGPILAGVGIVGLAVGFGAQHLVRDLVSGFFLLIENQVRVGDVATVNNVTGVVEAITFRTVILRDHAGVVHVFPNGMINTLANATLDWSAAVVDITLPFRADTDRAIAGMRRIGAEMQGEPEFANAIVAPVEVFGIENLTDTTATIRARLKTRPGEQYAISREFRRRLKHELQTSGLLETRAVPAASEVPRPLAAPTS